MQWMCEQKLHPPGFTIKISTTEFECRNIDLSVEFPGAVIANTRYEDGATIDYTVELKNSDVCPDTAKGSLNLLYTCGTILCEVTNVDLSCS